MKVANFLGFLVYVSNTLFNNTRLFDENHLPTESAIAFIWFFEYMENDISAILYLESGLFVHISWNTEASRKQHRKQN